MKIGEYIRKRREAAGMSIAEVCAMAPDKPVAIAALTALESGEATPTEEDLFGLWQIFGFCPDTAVAILREEPHQVCRVCACSDRDACVTDDAGPCWWVEDDLCSHCPPETP